MTIIYPHEKKPRFNHVSHKAIYENFKKGKYKQTHKRITNEEFWTLPKIFVDEKGGVSIVTGNQSVGGNTYIEHCKSHNCFIDRKNGVIVLKRDERFKK
jgi:hypothetical protein